MSVTKKDETQLKKEIANITTPYKPTIKDKTKKATKHLKLFFDFKNKKARKQLEIREKNKQEFLMQLKRFHNLITSIDKKLPNRHVRKQFWRDFIHDGTIRQEFIKKIIEDVKKT